MRRDNWECAWCWREAKTLHHKNENQRDNTKHNLLPLCQEHRLESMHKKSANDYCENPNKLRRCRACDVLFKPEPSKPDAVYCHEKCQEWREVQSETQAIADGSFSVVKHP